MPQAIIVAFDRFPARMCGCYGNEQIETPNLDRLAAEAVLFEQHFADHVSKGKDRCALWTGRYDFVRQVAAGTSPIRAMRDAGVHTEVFVEDGCAQRLTDEFDVVHAVHGRDGDAARPAETPFTRLASQVAARLDNISLDDDVLLWLQSRGLPAACDPPQAFLEPYQHSEPPDRKLDDVRHDVARAACATLVDLALGKLLDRTDPHEAPQRLLLVTALQGTDWHTGFDNADRVTREFAEDAVHLPLLIRLEADDTGRRQGLTQTVDLMPTLLDWFGCAQTAVACDGQNLLPVVRGDSQAVRDVAWTCNDHGWSVRTSEFCMVSVSGEHSVPLMSAGDESRGRCRLFLQPDDPWLIHDVAVEYPDVVSALHTRLLNFVSRQDLRPDHA